MPRDRRQHERVTVVAAVELCLEGEVEILPVRNLSVGGLLLEARPEHYHVLTPGTRFELTLTLSEEVGGDSDQGPILRTVGRVVHRSRGTGPGATPGVGVIFENLTPDEEERIHVLIATHARLAISQCGFTDAYDHAHDPVFPHGGILVSRYADMQATKEVLALFEGHRLPEITLTPRETTDLQLVARGAYSPLTGFLCRADYERVVVEGRLASGVLWTIPLTLSARADAGAVSGKTILLRDSSGQPVGAMKIEEVFPRDRAREARKILGTDESASAAVGRLMREESRILFGGPVIVLERGTPVDDPPPADPRLLRALFRERGWRRIVALGVFEPPQRAHEYLAKTAMEHADGLLINVCTDPCSPRGPLDRAELLRCYEWLVADRFPKNSVILVATDLPFAGAGSREEVALAIVHKNYGCTHHVVGGRNAAITDSKDAQRAFTEYPADELGIVPLCFEQAFFCRECAGMATRRTCPHGVSSRIDAVLDIRARIAEAKKIPAELLRPEIASLLELPGQSRQPGQPADGGHDATKGENVTPGSSSHEVSNEESPAAG
ncbi:MAG: PilZ domain-containing protein [Pseudomonadota bacterium]